LDVPCRFAGAGGRAAALPAVGLERAVKPGPRAGPLARLARPGAGLLAAPRFDTGNLSTPMASITIGA
jgi:hypothetical protein